MLPRPFASAILAEHALQRNELTLSIFVQGHLVCPWHAGGLDQPVTYQQ